MGARLSLDNRNLPRGTLSDVRFGGKLSSNLSQNRWAQPEARFLKYFDLVPLVVLFLTRITGINAPDNR